MKRVAPLVRRTVTAALCSALIIMPVAQAVAASPEEARTFVDSVASKALAVIADKSLAKDKKEDKLEKLFSSSVDIPWVARFTLGHYWHEATEAQRSKYLKEYESFWVKHYASRFAEYTGGNYKITGATEDENGQYTVSMVMNSAENGDVQVEYHVHMDGGQMKIYDVVVEGVSMIATQRSEFASVIGNKGLDYLIDQLAHRSLGVGEQK